jgi:proteic killer suppression protein
MDISFKNKKLEKQLTDDYKRLKTHGPNRAYKLGLLLNALKKASSLATFTPGVPPHRCHELNEGKRGNEQQISADLDFPYRLIFKPAENLSALDPDGSIIWAKVASIKILGIEDTHE